MMDLKAIGVINKLNTQYAKNKTNRRISHVDRDNIAWIFIRSFSSH